MGLAYNGTTGRLSVEILRAASLRSWSSATSTSSNSFSSSVSSSVSAAVTRQPDVCVKLLLLSQTGQELDRAKTSLKKMSQVDGPTWLESFSFQVTLFQLAEVTLVLSVINKRSLKRRQLVGWISLGYDNSTEHQTLHWHEMMDAGGEQVCHWHQLMPPSSLSSTNKDHH
jgi:synaptotagmin-14/16